MAKQRLAGYTEISQRMDRLEKMQKVADQMQMKRNLLGKGRRVKVKGGDKKAPVTSVLYYHSRFHFVSIHPRGKYPVPLLDVVLSCTQSKRLQQFTPSSGSSGYLVYSAGCRATLWCS